MESFAFSLLTSKNIQLKFTCEESVFDLLLPVEVKHNVYLIFKEAINNAVKYSGSNNRCGIDEICTKAVSFANRR